MKNFLAFLSLIMLLPVICAAQEFSAKGSAITLDGRNVTITIGVGASKTIWFALPPSIGLPARPEVDTSATVNPPNRVSWNGVGSVIIRLKSGSASDSTRLLMQGIDEAGVLIDNRDQYLAGSATTFSSVFSNNNAKEFPITSLFDAIFGFKLTFTNGDLTGGNRVYEVKLSLQ
jgi:hypothetical protein